MSQIFSGFGAQASNYDAPHILIGHWNVRGSKLSTGQMLTGMDIELSVDQMMLSCADLILLGHIHKSQQLGDRTFYTGSIYATNWGEMEPKGFYIHEIGKESRFIETPTRKLARVRCDFTDDAKPVGGLRPEEDLTGAFVRLDYTVWQDEAGTVDKEAIRKSYMDAGALDVDIRIIRKPRETVRSEAVLKVESLRDKLTAMAALKNETVPESILQKADELESRTPDELINALAGAKAEVAA